MSPPHAPAPKTMQEQIEAGALVDLSPEAQRAGFPHPVAMTPAALAALSEPGTPKPALSATMTRLLMETATAFAKAYPGVNAMGFLLTTQDGDRSVTCRLRLTGEGAKDAPAFTYMLEDEAVPLDLADALGVPPTRFGSLWDGAEVISTYTRAQAIADGFLVDLTDLSKNSGIKYPVAITNTALAEVTGDESAYFEAVLDLLAALMRAIVEAAPDAERVDFTLDPGNGRRESVALYATCGPGDDPAPVLTIMLPGED